MRIELVNLEDGRGAFEHVFEPQELIWGDERVKLSGPASVVGNIRQSGTEVVVSGHVDTSIEVDCDRCLKPIQLPVSTDFSLEYITSADYQESDAAELTEEAMSVSVFDGESIDLGEIVKEQILLAVPTRSLCNENCKGLCPTCGANRNVTECGCEESKIDPRWAALKDLMSGKS